MGEEIWSTKEVRLETGEAKTCCKIRERAGKGINLRAWENQGPGG